MGPKMIKILTIEVVFYYQKDFSARNKTRLAQPKKQLSIDGKHKGPP